MKRVILKGVIPINTNWEAEVKRNLKWYKNKYRLEYTKLEMVQTGKDNDFMYYTLVGKKIGENNGI